MLKQLLRLYQERVMLDSVQSVIGWDQETYMPPGAIQARARQSAYLSEKSHAIMSSDGFRAAIETLVDVSTGQVSPDVVDPLHRRMISEAYREWKYAVSLPSGLVCELAELTSQAQHEWQIAKKNNNYSHFEPYLRRVVHLTHRKIDYLGYSERPYDALLDIFEPGVSTTHLTALFSDLKQLTIRTIQTQKNADQNAQFPEGPYDLAQQQELSLAVLKLMGFDFNRGRLDISAHPFSTSFHPTDCRITTRYHDGDLMDSLSSTMHEGGHALYEQGIPTDYFGTPIGTSISLGIHESQSRMWENMVGKSRAFCEGIFPKVVAHFPQIRPLGADGLYHAVNRVSPSLIRVDADEVTYNLHVLIRFELEQLLFSNTITTQELPDAWNQKYRDYLGIVPPSDSKGVLQDVHWSIGAFGYFPTYSLGNLYAAQFYEIAEQEIPNLESEIRNLNLIPLKDWLNRRVHAVGRTMTADELIHSVSGRELGIEAFGRYLGKKFS